MYENLRLFFAEIPLFSRFLQAELASIVPPNAGPDELKQARLEAQRKVSSSLKENKELYAVISFPDSTWTCPHCGEEIAGAYWELNNPVAAKGMSVPLKLFHLFLDHGEIECLEPIHNLNGNSVGEALLTLDLEGLFKVMKGAWLPDGVKAEIEEGL
ncbi:MAG TPA: hypothetical protein DD435_04150 [Cyanobacteria bacterium UBA8530]|nr:hypothetical protein [Cyanobacteria bacterium UBA8530]